MTKHELNQYAADYFYLAYKAGEDLDEVLDYLVNLGEDQGTAYYARLIHQYRFYKEMRTIT